MKIVHIGTSGVPILHRFGGALQRRIMEMARLQASAGHEVVVLSSGSRSSVETVDNVSIRTLPLVSRRPARDYEMLARARQWLSRSGKVDILHAHGAPAAATALRAWSAAAIHSVDFFRYRGSATSVGRRYYTARLDAFDLNVAASAYCAREFGRYYPRLAAKTRVLYNGVNRGQFRPDPRAASRARDELGIPSGPLVVYLGRVCAQKGSDLLGPLAVALRSRVPDAVVVAAGPSEQFAQTGSSELADSLVRCGVRRLGAIDESLVAGLLAAASVFVLPTRQDEMFGMAALEAVACGVPVVAADLGGIPEAIGPCGILFPVGDANALIEAVTTILEDPSLALAIRNRGAQHVERFDWTSIVDDSMTHYMEALEYASSPRPRS